MILQSSAYCLLVCVIASIGGQHRVEAQRWEKIVECDSRAPNDRRLLFTVDDVKEKAAAGTQVRTPRRPESASSTPACPPACTHARNTSSLYTITSTYGSPIRRHVNNFFLAKSFIFCLFFFFFLNDIEQVFRA